MSDPKIRYVVVDWALYPPFIPKYAMQAHRLTSGQAAEEFEHFMATRHERVVALTDFAAQYGVEVDFTNGGIVRLGDWFRTYVAASDDVPGQLENMWYGVAHDMGVFIAEALISRYPNLKWRLLKRPKTHIHFQRPVLSGFPGSDLSYDFVRTVVALGHSDVFGAPEKRIPSDYLIEVFETACRRAEGEPMDGPAASR